MKCIIRNLYTSCCHLQPPPPPPQHKKKKKKKKSLKMFKFLRKLIPIVYFQYFIQEKNVYPAGT